MYLEITFEAGFAIYKLNRARFPVGQSAKTDARVDERIPSNTNLEKVN